MSGNHSRVELGEGFKIIYRFLFSPMKQKRAKQILVRRIQRDARFPFRIEKLLVTLRRLRRFDILGIETEGDNEVLMSRPVSLLVEKIFRYSFAAGREIRIDQPMLHKQRGPPRR